LLDLRQAAGRGGKPPISLQTQSRNFTDSVVKITIEQHKSTTCFFIIGFLNEMDRRQTLMAIAPEDKEIFNFLR
jgi:hypothetical protein